MRVDGVEVALAVRAERDRLVALLESAAVPCVVGRRGRDGWWPVRLPAGTESGSLAPGLSVGTGSVVVGVEVDGDRELVVLSAWRDGTGPVRLTAAAGGTPQDAEQAERFAAAVGCPDAGGRLGRLLADSGGPAGVLAAAGARLLGLPDGLVVTEPASAVIAYRGDRSSAEMTASIAGGSASVAAVADGWVLLAEPADPARPSLRLAAGLSSIAGRRSPVLWVWRDGEECGYVLWRRGRPRDVHVWTADWQLVAGDGTTGEAVRHPFGDAAVVADAMGRPEAAVPLRALLRRQDTPAALIADLAATLALPPQVPAVLTGEVSVGQLPDASRPESASPLAAARAHSRAAAPPGGLGWALATVVAALVSAALTALGVAVLLTDGRAVDQPGVTAEDWVFAVAGAVLTAILTRAAARRLRGHARRSDPAG